MSDNICVDKHIDVDSIVDGIIAQNEHGTMFFSVINQNYSADIANMLCSGLRSYADKDELKEIIKSTNANNFHDLVIKTCDKILKNVDKMIIILHNKIKDATKNKGGENNDY